MKSFLKIFLAIGITAAALSGVVKAQSVQVSGIGSSALFLEAGLGAWNPNGPIKATCVWSGKSGVVATDTSVSNTSLTDTGNAWVAWTTGGGTCAAPGTSAQIYAYLQTDSVVGNRCLFNGALSTPECKISYESAAGTTPANLILAGPTTDCGNTTTPGECALPAAIAHILSGGTATTAGTGHAPNAAGTDIRPEDAEFATARAIAPCGQAVATGSSYQGLGYSSGEDILSFFSSSSFHVINFSLPSSYTVTPVGATPIVVVVNKTNTSGFGQSTITNLSSSTLAKFLDGTFSFVNQATNPSANSGAVATVVIREPLSGTYNTMEFNVPNTISNTLDGDTGNFTSQDVGQNQASAQKNCSGTGVSKNPLDIATTGGGKRVRAIGTGQELTEVSTNTDALGYAFWSVANFASSSTFNPANVKYLTVDGIDPLLDASTPYSTFNGAIPTTGSTELSHVDLHTLNSTQASGTFAGFGNTVNYPIWSLIRLVNTGSAVSTGVANLASAAQAFVSFGTTSSRPDFKTPSQLTVVRSHFVPPAGVGQPAAANLANGDSKLGTGRTSCTKLPETGGDVGGVVISLTKDSSSCSSTNTAGTTTQRR